MSSAAVRASFTLPEAASASDEKEGLRLAGVVLSGLVASEGGSGTFFLRPPLGSQPLGGPRFFCAPYSQTLESLEQLLQGCRPSHLTLRREHGRQALLDRMRPESFGFDLLSSGDGGEDGLGIVTWSTTMPRCHILHAPPVG